MSNLKKEVQSRDKQI